MIAKSEGLGSRFVSEVGKMIDYVSHNPHHFQVKYKDYREAVITKFPYVLIYQIKNVLIIFHLYFLVKITLIEN